MDEILTKLLEQTPVVVTMGVGLYALWAEIKRREEVHNKDREEYKKEIARLTDISITREGRTIETLENVSTLQEETRGELKEIKFELRGLKDSQSK